jgi:hypothetical protein
MATESSGHSKLTLEGAGVVLSMESDDDTQDWSAVLRGALKTWHSLHSTVHAARLEEIKDEQSARPGPATAGFIQEGMHEKRNETLPGGTGVRPV